MLRYISNTTGLILASFALFLSTTLLTGCADGVFTADETETTTHQDDENKFRQAHLLDRALRTAPGKSASSGMLGLIIGVQSGVDKQRVVDRYKVANRYRISNRYSYDNALYGFAWTIEDSLGLGDYQEFLSMLALDPDIIWFEPDFDVNSPAPSAAPGGSSQQIPWSVTAVGGPSSWTVSGDGTGSVNVDVYILDTGITNDDLNIVESVDFRDGFNDAADHDGHGTHVAGIIGAVDDSDGLVGLAPGARIHNHKVLDDNGRGDISQVIAAIEQITTTKLSNPSTPIVVNLSLGEDIGSGAHSALDDAVSSSVAAGVVYIVAAGNHGKDVADITPAKVESAITVGAYAFDGSYADFSNYGLKVDLLAPGEGVVSLSPGSNPVEMTGTSMAAAHVTGAAALYLAQNPAASPAQVEQALVNSAMDFVSGAQPSTTTKSVWVGTPQTYRDEFNTISYSNNDGTASWSSDWTEIGENSGPSSGDIQVTTFPNSSPVLGLRIREGRGAQREVDLSGALSAVLSFDYRRVNFDQSSDHATVEISANGGASWTQLDLLQGPDRDTALQPASYDISAYASSNTIIRFVSSSSVDGGERVYFKDMQIETNGGNGGGGNGGGGNGGGGNGGGGNGTPTTFETRISSDNDDAEEEVHNGDMDRGSSDLELVSEGSTAQLVGMRFTGISVPQGATITNAYIQFTVDETDSGTTNLTIRGQDTDDAASFSSSDDDISDRPTTSASKAWSPPAWNSVGAAGADQRTPDLSAIVQEIVSRGGWSSGNDMVLIVTGSGERTAESHDGSSSKAPLLHIEYQ